MQESDNKPIIFLAFTKQYTAVDKDDLRRLPDEIKGIREAIG